MAKIRNKSGQALEVPGLGVVEASGVVEVPDSDVYNYTQQSIWDPVGKADQALHDKGQRSVNKAVKAEVAEVEEPPAVVPNAE